ncbi:hypothetical protein MTR_3g052880 [Medicago truncatula]|uniref:Uncharacterized protein n=1 Tax=Medicago truncatula TaxID=3880 RepID=A0A072UWB8_MEDTR|nr:hypothetical protein MTR_3g052880 [Medicago truncatula]
MLRIDTTIVAFLPDLGRYLPVPWKRKEVKSIDHLFWMDLTDYWKVRMITFLKCIDIKTWKAVIKGCDHPCVKDKDGKDTSELKPEEECDGRMKEYEENITDGEPQSKEVVVLDGVVPIFQNFMNTNFSQ